MLSPSPSLSLLISMVVSLPGFTSHVAGSWGGSSTLGARLPPTELLACVDGPPCCLSTALPWCCPPAGPVDALSFDWVDVACANDDVDDEEEEEEEEEDDDDELDSDGAGSTGVIVEADAAGASPLTAASSDVAEMAPGTADSEADWLGECEATLSGDCGADWLAGCSGGASSPADDSGSEVDEALCAPGDGPKRAGFGAIAGFGGISANGDVSFSTGLVKLPYYRH